MVNFPLPTWLRADCMSPVRPPDPLTVTEARLWELLPAPPATNATVNCSSESTPFLPSWAGTPPEASSRWGVGGSGAEALSDPGRDENWSFQHFSKLHLTKSGQETLDDHNVQHERWRTWGSRNAAKFLPTNGAGAVQLKPGNDAPGVEAVLALKLLHSLPVGEVLGIWE